MNTDKYQTEKEIDKVNSRLKVLERKSKTDDEWKEFDELVTKLQELNQEYLQILKIEEQDEIENQNYLVFDAETRELEMESNK